MVIKKSFTLLVTSGTTPFFAFFSIIFVNVVEMMQNIPCGLLIQRDVMKNLVNTDLEAILTVSLRNDVKSAVTEMMLSDWSVLQNFKLRQINFFLLYKRVSTHFRLIPNLPSYRPKVFTITARRNLLHIQFKIIRFL